MIRRQWLRRSYSHGCSSLAGCGRVSRCPRRIANSRVGILKSKAGRRDLVAPIELITVLKEHRATQNVARLRAGDCWHDDDWVFTGPDGRPVDHRVDARAFKTVLQTACVRSARIHDLRHTNATILLVEGIDPRVVQELMGWSPSAMAAMAGRYQHVVASLRQEAAAKVGKNIFGTG